MCQCYIASKCNPISPFWKICKETNVPNESLEKYENTKISIYWKTIKNNYWKTGDGVRYLHPDSKK